MLLHSLSECPMDNHGREHFRQSSSYGMSSPATEDAGGTETRLNVFAGSTRPQAEAFGNASAGGYFSLSPEILPGAIKAIDISLIVGMAIGGLAVLHLTEETGRYILISLLAAMLFTTMLHGLGAYKLTQLVMFNWQLTHVAGIWGLTALGVLSAALLSKVFESYSAGWAIGWIVTTLAALLVERVLLGFAIEYCSRLGYLAHNVIIVGGGQEGERLIAKIARSQDKSIAIRGIFDDRRSRIPDAVLGCKVLGTTDELLHFARRVRVDEVIISLPLNATHRVNALINKLGSLAVDLRLSGEPMIENFKVDSMSYIDDVPLFGLFRRPINNWSAVAKWVEDKVLGVVLLVFLAPLMAFIAILIKLESAGPIIFVQKRFGFNNNIIKVYKFRTMYTYCSDITGAQRTVRSDPRVTRIGRLLRSLSLDELPQLFNVLKGDMSLVGPRPHPLPMMAGSRPYCDVVERYAYRHRVKPGITGWAQVNGYRGEVDTIEKARARIEHDLFYIEEWSLWLDLKTLAMTVIMVISGQRAY